MRSFRFCTASTIVQLPSIVRLSVYASFVSQFSSSALASFSTRTDKMSGTLSSTTDAPLSKLAFQRWNDDAKAQVLKQVIVPLSPDSHKGTSGGRLAILGGSEDYTGAPFYAAMSALQTGADLAYVWTAHEAMLPLKSYSPEIMVSSVYHASAFDQAKRNRSQSDSDNWSDDMEQLVADMVSTVVDKCRQRRLHALVIGPGLGRDQMLLEAIKRIITQLQFEVPMVLDADALYMLSVNDNASKVFGKSNATDDKGKDGSRRQQQRRIILTPNVMEYKRLFGEERPDFGSDALSWASDLTIVEKAGADIIRHGTTCLECHEDGGLKRSGGIGDILSGCLGTLLAWQTLLDDKDGECQENEDVRQALVGWTACCFIKRATKRAFEEKKRAMTAPDILAVLGSVIDEMTREED